MVLSGVLVNSENPVLIMSTLPLLAARSSNRFRSSSSFKSIALVGAVAAPAVAHAQTILGSGALNTDLASSDDSTYMDFGFGGVHGDPVTTADLTLSVSKDNEVQPTIFGDAEVHLTALNFGDTIDGNLAFSDVDDETNLSIPAGTYYYGFSYNTEAGDQFGWFAYSTTAVDGKSSFSDVTSLGWAIYDTAGITISAGQTSAVPEPGATAALIGGVILAATMLRRRRSTKR